ncbi:MAG: hypothetical protein ACTSR8_18645 [Promethearchaeota archaeon]
MSIEFEELEEPLSRLGSLVVLIAAVILMVFGALGLPILNNVTTFGTSSLAVGYTFLFIMLIALVITLLNFLCFARPWLKFKINVFIASIISLILFIGLILTIPGEPVTPAITMNMNLFVWIGIGGVASIFISKRPNLGKESNKHIYQAYGAVIEFIVASCLLLLGVYVIFFNIADFAGNGTFPGGFETTYINDVPSIVIIYSQVRTAGIIMIIAALIIMIASLVRNIITLKVASIVIFAGIIVALSGISYFFTNWILLDQKLDDEYPDEYSAQLKLSDPIVFDLGVVLIMLLFLGLVMIIYASSQSEPLEKWRTRRNHNLAAAEVAIRDQKLQKALRYLEQASILSSKLGEEDRSVELITRMNSIKEKAIKMRKAEAAERKKKELERAKQKAASKAPKPTKPKEEKPEK